MSLYNNFNDETEGDVLGNKIGRLIVEMKSVLNRVFIIRKIVRVRYQDGSSIVEHLNAFRHRGLPDDIISDSGP